MGERKYTVQEIDELRSACKKRWLFGTTEDVSGEWSRTYQEDDMTKCVEELVRTYMLAGIIADDIRERDRKVHHKQ